MQLMSNIKKAAAAFVGAVTMAVAVPTAKFANMPVMADEPSGIEQMTTVPFMTTKAETNASDYSYMLDNGHEEGPRLLVGDKVDFDLTVFHYTGISFPDEMTVMEQCDGTCVAYYEPKTIKCEKLSDGRRRWKAECAEITYEEGCSTVEIKSLKVGETCFFLGEEEKKMGDNDIYRTKAILYVESMDQASYDYYIQDLNEHEKINPTEAPTYDSYEFYEAIGSPETDLIVGEKTIIDVQDPFIDLNMKFSDYDPFSCRYEPESETSKYFDVKKIGDRKFEITAKSEGYALLCIGSNRKGYVKFSSEQLNMSFEKNYCLYMDGTDAEKSREIDLADGYYYLGRYSWNNKRVTFDTKHPFTVETVKYDDSTDSYVEAEPEVAKIEPTDKNGVFRLTALKEGYQYFVFTEESGVKWIYHVFVTTHVKEEEENNKATWAYTPAGTVPYEGGTIAPKTIPLAAAGTNAADTVSAMMGDVNNDYQVTLADSLAILQYLANANKYGLSDRMLLNADIVDRGEGVTAQDALAIQKIDAKALKESDLPLKSSKL